MQTSLCTYRLKVISFFLLFGLLCKSQQNDILNRQINLSCDSCEINEVFEQIENQIGFYFSYNTKIFNPGDKITAHFVGQHLKTVLDSILDCKSIDYKLIEKQIILFRAEEESETLTNIIEPRVLELRISGKIVENGTNIPVSFANIAVFGKPVGTIANNSGEFILKLPLFYEENFIGFSCIGYKTLFIPVKEALQKSEFILEPEFVPIQEVIIRNTDPLYLIKNAISGIDKNYSITPFILTSFYRETIKKGNDFIGITEAVIQTFKNGYSKNYAVDRVKLIKGRKTQSINPGDTLIIKLKGGINTTLLLDLVKNFPEFLSEDYFKYYRYGLADIIYEDNKEIYVIDFRQKENIKDPLYYGKIYIGVKDLSLLGFEFALNETNIEKAWNRFVVKKPSWLKVKPVKAEYSVKYKSYQNKYYLNSIRSETVFKVRNRNKLFANEFSSKLEMAVTDIDTSVINPIRVKESLNTEAIFVEEFSESAELFWSGYNFIKPDEPLEEVINKLK